MTPPELTAYTPVFGICHPVTVSILEFGRIELNVTIHHSSEGRLRKFIHLQEPLH